jgi:hypothetical protein
VTPLVKVVVPCYRYAGVLEGCVDSVLAQEGVEVRVLIVDDCSPDETPAVAARIVERDPRVEYRRHAENQGLLRTANAGLEWAADSDYVVLISADDMLVPGSLGRAVSVMEADERIGMVYGHAEYFSSERPLPRIAKRWRGTTVWAGREWIRLRCRKAHNCISSPEVVVRTSVQRKVGAYSPSCTHTQDLNMWLRIAAVADVAYVRGATQALYRVHSEGMLRSALASRMGPLLDLTERRTAFFEFFDAVGDRLEGADELRASCERALARQALWLASRAYDRGAVEGPDSVPVEELISFALETCPQTRRLREWRGLWLRKRIGAGRSLWFAPFIVTGAAHRLYGHLNRARWRACGI